MGKTRKNRPLDADEIELINHLQGLGCATVEDYQEWCAQNGLKKSLNKGRIERQRETEIYRRLQGQVAMRSARQFSRRPEAVLTAISNGELEGLNLKGGGFLSVVASLFAPLKKEPQVRKAFLRLLLATVRTSDFQRGDTVYHRIRGEVNTYAGGLLSLARHHARWKRGPEEWKPSRHNARRQFSELARFLLCSYDVPIFLESAWFRGNDQTAREQQEWYIGVGRGESLRSLKLPLRLTKKMAHLAVTQVPANCTAEEGWRWAQVLGMGGTERLARAIIASPLGNSFQEEEFWETVVRFFVDNPLLDISRIGPLVDYLRYERYSPRRANDRNRLPTNFTMKGRTAAALLARMEVWHRQTQTQRVPRGSVERWEPCGINGYSCEEALQDRKVLWTIEEITSAKGLIEEGRDMSHCVGSYAWSCSHGSVSIWSLKHYPCAQDDFFRVMTIAINRDGVVSEVRGRRNALPGNKQDSFGGRLSRREADLLDWGYLVFKQWVARERLTLPHYAKFDV